MTEQTGISFDSLAVENSDQGIFIFNNEGLLLRGNGKASLLVDAFEPGAMVVCENDLLSLFGLAPLNQRGYGENKYATNKRKNIFIHRKKTDEDFVIYYLLDTTGERLRMAALHQQTSGVLWKVRSKVTSIQNALSYILEYELDRFDNSVGDLLSTSRFEIWQLSRYTDNLRDLALLNGNMLGKQVDIESVSLKECVAEAVRNLETFKKNWGKKVSFIDTTPAWPILCDKFRFVRIVESIFINSVFYSRADVTISIDAAEGNEENIVVHIKDNGPGLSDDDLPKLFGYGYRGQAARAAGFPGLGIELFLARQILLRMNGGIEIDNHPGKGTETILTVKKGAGGDE
jgi:K+-sensing histidine kinase KdpD